MNKGELNRNKKLDRFIAWGTSGGRNMFSIQKIDERIRIAAKFLSGKKILVVCTELDEEYCKKFGDLIGAQVTSGYSSSALSNPENKDYFEPEILLVTNVDESRNAVDEAVINRLPVVAFCNTDSDTSGVDLIIPINTTNRNGIGVALWLILNEMKSIKKEKSPSLDDFLGEKSEE